MRQVKVWDPLVRSFHWGLALLVLSSFLTSDHDPLVPVHVKLGLAVVALVLARVVWGFLGPAHARFRAFVRGPRAVAAYARELVRGRPPLHLSHNPLGGAMVVTLLVLLLAVAATGAVVYAGPAFEGPLTGLLTKREAKGVKELHEALSTGLVALVVLHVVGVLASSLLEGQNLVRGMITGWKRAPEGADGEAEPRRPLLGLVRVPVALAVGVAAAVGLATLIGLPQRANAGATSARAGEREHEDNEEDEEDERWDSGEDRVKIPRR